jgi:hypothetical protein
MDGLKIIYIGEIINHGKKLNFIKNHRNDCATTKFINLPDDEKEKDIMIAEYLIDNIFSKIKKEKKEKKLEQNFDINKYKTELEMAVAIVNLNLLEIKEILQKKINKYEFR